MNAVSTKENLAHRKCVIDPVCPICGVEVETIEHAIFRCEWASSVWSLCGLAGFCVEITSVCNWVEKVLSAGGFKKLSFCAFVCWAIWNGRNNFMFALKDVSPSSTVEWAYSFFDEFSNVALSSHPSMPGPLSISSVVWSPPLVGVLKINCDAAWKNAETAFGCVIRNHEGLLLECFGARFRASSVLMAEAMAIREACIFCLKGGIRNVVIECDNASVVSWCDQSGKSPQWDCISIVADISALAINVNVSFNLIRREANRAADALARWVLKLGCVPNLSSIPLALRQSFDVS